MWDRKCALFSLFRTFFYTFCSSVGASETHLIWHWLEWNFWPAHFLSFFSFSAFLTPLPPKCPVLFHSRWLGHSYFCFLLYNSICCAFPLTVKCCLCAVVCLRSSDVVSQALLFCVLVHTECVFTWSQYSVFKRELFSWFVLLWNNVSVQNLHHCMCLCTFWA